MALSNYQGALCILIVKRLMELHFPMVFRQNPGFGEKNRCSAIKFCHGTVHKNDNLNIIINFS